MYPSKDRAQVQLINVHNKKLINNLDTKLQNFQQNNNNNKPNNFYFRIFINN